MISLALSGKKGSGKDTVGTLATSILEERHGWCYLHQPLARALKDQVDHALEVALDAGPGNAEGAVADALGLHPCVAGGLVRRLRTWPGGTTAWDSSVPAVRPTLIWYGQARRAERADYWLEQAFRAATRHRLHGDQPTLVTDARFRNEAEAFTSEAGHDGPHAEVADLPPVVRPWLLARVECSDEIRHARLRDRDGHVDLESEGDTSERELDGWDGWDLVVNNERDDPKAAALEIVRAVEARCS